MIWVFGFAIGLTGLFWVVSQRMRRIELKEFRRLLYSKYIYAYFNKEDAEQKLL
jgi:hypothetical protein